MEIGAVTLVRDSLFFPPSSAWFVHKCSRAHSFHCIDHSNTTMLRTACAKKSSWKDFRYPGVMYVQVRVAVAAPHPRMGGRDAKWNVAIVKTRHYTNDAKCCQCTVFLLSWMTFYLVLYQFVKVLLIANAWWSRSRPAWVIFINCMMTGNVKWTYVLLA